MSLKINLLKIEEQPAKKRRLLIVFMASYLAFLLAMILFVKKSDNLIYWFYLVFLSSWGMVTILNSYGISLKSFFGKAYIDIDDNEIVIKATTAEKEFRINWSQVRKIEFTYNGILFSEKDGNLQRVKYSEFMKSDYRRQIEEMLREIADRKAIELIEFQRG